MEGAQRLMTGEKHVMHTDFPSVTAYLDSAKLENWTACHRCENKV